MKVLALDISTKTGWAIFEDGKPTSWGTVFPDKTVKDFGFYPMNYILLAEHLNSVLFRDVIYPFLGQFPMDPNTRKRDGACIVIEETNSSKQNYSQKRLEYLHFVLVKTLGYQVPVYYIRSGEWRTACDSKMNAAEKSLNAKIGRIKKKTGKKLAKIDGKVVGKKNRKTVALRRCEEILGIQMKRKEEDAADALLLGLGYLRGAPVCDGTTTGGKSPKKVKNG